MALTRRPISNLHGDQMADKPKFTVDGGAPAEADVALAPTALAAPDQSQDTIAEPPLNSPDRDSAYSRTNFTTEDVEEAGLQLALHVEAGGYHPVILFGNAASGKTSLLLSLFATIKTEPELHTGLFLGEPILDLDTEYGRYLHENSEQFFGQKTQDFIEGKAAPKTALQFPFFVPITFRPDNKPEMKFAFMESNGEWYRPDRSSGRLFPALRRQIEDFISNYQGGITFIHLIPYTQRAVYSAAAEKVSDAAEIQDASLAISGALQAYEKIRINKQNDRHLMLVTKWDAHSPPNVSKYEVLTETSDDVARFANESYAQALTTFRGIGLHAAQMFLNSYCAGLMNEMGVLVLKQSNELRSAVINYPVKLWEWLYRGALEASDQFVVDPFPAPPPRSPWQEFIDKWLNRFF